MKQFCKTLIFLWILLASPAAAQYVRDDCTTLKLSATTKATCFDYTSFKLRYWNGAAFVDSVVNAAPVDATYITQTANGTLTQEQAIGALSTGLLKGTTTTGTISIGAAGTDYVAPGAITTSGLTQATARLLGRTTASSGAVEEISVGSGLSLSAGTIIAAAGGAVAAGSDTQVQFNDGGTALGGDGGLTYNKTTDALTVGALVTVPKFSLTKEVVIPVTETTMSGNATLTAGTSNTYQFFDTNGSNRDVTLPTAATGLTYLIMNIGAQTITVKDAGASTVGTIAAGAFATLIYSGSAWRML